MDCKVSTNMALLQVGPAQKIRVIDSHTAGEPTRVVLDGGPDLGSGTFTQRRALFSARYDHYRRAIIQEPHGHQAMVGALLVEPTDCSCLTGVIFFNNVGYLGMCGHGTIGLVKTLQYLGRIGPGQHRIETPVGVITTWLDTDGQVTVTNVPSYRTDKDLSIQVPGVGTIVGDIAWGGNWFFITSDHGLDLDMTKIDELIALAHMIRDSVHAQGFRHVDHIELIGPAANPNAQGRSFVLCPGGAYDRCPCGTGLSAKLACLAADGQLAEGQPWIQEGILGSCFRGTYRWLENGQILPSITGTAYITAEATLLLDQSDPFCWGIGQ
ncbi:MAG: proline racemase family protein [Sedimentisphaerales bacterium]|nr:proline racemase family protein [Sedimentisphaerales bacterium]